jgi:hypothetical protein
LNKSILIISPGQFGSHNGTYQYCKLLSKIYSVTYFGFNENRPEILLNNLNIIHLERRSNAFFSKVYFIKNLRDYLKSKSYDYVLINYFLGCSILNFFVRYKNIVDVRSGYIYQNNFKRILYNFALLFEVSTFKNITVISRNLAGHLKLPKRAHHIPLGSPVFPNWVKKYDSFKILYVGTFHQRNIDQAIRGFSKFYLEYKDLIHIEMSIIGGGSPKEIKIIEDAIIDSNMSHSIKFLGVIRYPELSIHFENNNIGLSYIPITEYFNFQPPTKTFEYLSSGMITIATSTIENISVINNNNGILILDNEESLFEGLKYIYQNLNNYNSTDIQSNSKQYSWDYIVYNNLIPYLNNIQ